MKIRLLLITLLAFNALAAQTKLLSSINQSFNGSTWDNNQGYNYEYDTNNNLIKSTSYVWSNGAWEELYIEFYTYNSNNRITQFLSQEYDINTNTYNNDFRETYTYISNNNATEILGESWNGSQWINDYKLDINYTGLAISNIFEQIWNGNTWINSFRAFVTNDSNNRIIEIINESWENNNWQITDRDVVTRNASGLVLTNSIELWDGGTYVENERTDYVIDGNGNRLSETNTYQGQTFIENFTYDSSELMSDFAHPFADKTGFDYATRSYPFINKILTSETNNTYRTVYNYDNLITLNLNSFTFKNSFTIFPNPVKTDLNIETTGVIGHIEIYNSLGLKLTTTKSTKINVEQLPKGAYILKVTDNNGNISVEKFIKK